MISGRARTRLINHVRGAVKSVGGHLTKCSSVSFATKALPHLPKELEPALASLLAAIATLDGQLRSYDLPMGSSPRNATPRRHSFTRFPAWERSLRFDFQGRECFPRTCNMVNDAPLMDVPIGHNVLLMVLQLAASVSTKPGHPAKMYPSLLQSDLDA